MDYKYGLIEFEGEVVECKYQEENRWSDGSLDYVTIRSASGGIELAWNRNHYPWTSEGFNSSGNLHIDFENKLIEE